VARWLGPWKFMDDREILSLLSEIPGELEKIEKKITSDGWPEVKELFVAIRRREEKISDPGTGMAVRLASDPQFLARYTEIRNLINAKINDVTRTIGSWKEAQLKKITVSRNFSDALNRYARQPDISFYVDKKE
jgi:hypothetical protein